MTSSFSRLPLEVLIIILEYAPNLSTIYTFICASAMVNAAFEISPARILDGAIERSIPEFKHLARMVTILGSFSASLSLHPTFQDLVDKYNNLPKDVLTTAPASSAFETGTPGPRYLVLTAYRIEILQHVCFVSLLQNIHEAIWYIVPTDEPESVFYSIKRSKSGIDFQAAAWWSPSWVEKTRITRALWHLIIYWNIQAIYPNHQDDYRLSQYCAAIRHISPCLEPDFKNDKTFLGHEVEEMKCLLAATRDLLSCTDDRCHLFTAFTSWTPPNFRINKCASIIFEEAAHWRYEEPKPMTGIRAWHDGQHSDLVSRESSRFRNLLWYFWFEYKWKHPKPENYEPQFPDYLGLCIWDCKRLGYLGLAEMYHGFLDRGPLRNPCNYPYRSTCVSIRWQEAFMQEVVRLPGGQQRQLSKDLETHIQEWKSIPQKLKVNLDIYRMEIPWGECENYINSLTAVRHSK